MGLGCRLGSRGCELDLPGSSSERASPQRGLSFWPAKGAQGSLRSPGRARAFRARPPHPRWGEGAGQIQSFLPAPLDSLPLLLGTAPPPPLPLWPLGLPQRRFQPQTRHVGLGGASCNQSWRSAPAPGRPDMSSRAQRCREMGALTRL